MHNSSNINYNMNLGELYKANLKRETVTKLCYIISYNITKDTIVSL